MISIFLLGKTYLFKNVGTVFNLKKEILQTEHLLVTSINTQDGLCLNNGAELEDGDSLIAVTENFKFEKKNGQYECDYCRELLNMNTFSCYHSAKCREEHTKERSSFTTPVKRSSLSNSRLSSPNQLSNISLLSRKKDRQLEQYIAPVSVEDELHLFYEPYYPNLIINDIKLLVNSSLSYGLYLNNIIVAAVTYKKVNIAGVNVIQILLLAVAKKYRDTNFANELLDHICQENDRLICWVDNNLVNFYKDYLDFTVNSSIGRRLNSIIPSFEDSTFMIRGLSLTEIRLILSGGPVGNIK
jgi:ribosomal protein S18 acetylase RimI-like enzyme